MRIRNHFRKGTAALLSAAFTLSLFMNYPLPVKAEDNTGAPVLAKNPDGWDAWNETVTPVNTNLYEHDPRYATSQTGETRQVTLLTGNSDLAGPTLKDTIQSYRNTFLMGVAADFCVFLKEDFIVHESDAEGRVAVGGNFNIQTSWGTYAVGAGDYKTHLDLDTLLVDRDGAATIIIGQELVGGKFVDVYYDFAPDWDTERTGLHVKYEGVQNGAANPSWNGDSNCWVYTPERKSTRLVVYNNPKNYYDQEFSDTYLENFADRSFGDWQNVDQTQLYTTQILDFEDSFQYLADVSTQLGEHGEEHLNDGTVTLIGDVLTFDYTGGTEPCECVYFTVDHATFVKAGTINFTNIPRLSEPRPVIDNDGTIAYWDYAYIIVNITGAGAPEAAGENGVVKGSDGKNRIYLADKDINDGGNKTTSINGESISQNNNYRGVTSLLYNLVDADSNTEVVLGKNFQGTVFAPLADVTDLAMVYNNGGQRGHLSGALIANSFEGYTEFGYRPYSGPVLILRDIEGDYSVAVNKVDGSDKNKPLLPGAVIGLYKINEDDNTVIEPGDVQTSQKETMYFKGLGVGNYVLREDKAPDNYQAAAPIYFSISEQAPITGSVTNLNAGETRTVVTYNWEQVKQSLGEKGINPDTAGAAEVEAALEKLGYVAAETPKKDTYNLSWNGGENDIASIVYDRNNNGGNDAKIELTITDCILHFSSGDSESISVNKIIGTYDWNVGIIDGNTSANRKSDIVSIGFVMKSDNPDTTEVVFTVKVGNAEQSIPVSNIPTDALQEIQIFPEPASDDAYIHVDTYYKRAQEGEPSLEIEVPVVGKIAVQAATTPNTPLATAEFSFTQGVLTVKGAGANGANAVYYTPDPLALTAHTYTVNGTTYKFTFTGEVTTDPATNIVTSGYEVHKVTEDEDIQVPGQDLLLYCVEQGDNKSYVVLNRQESTFQTDITSKITYRYTVVAPDALEKQPMWLLDGSILADPFEFEIVNIKTVSQVDTGLKISKTVVKDGNVATDDHTLYVFSLILTLPDDTGLHATYPAAISDKDLLAEDHDAPEIKFTAKKEESFAFRLANGETLYIEDLPVGTSYKVEETSTSDNYTSRVDEKGSDKTGELDADNIPKVTFINTYTTPIVEIGDLDISKTVIGDGAPADDTFTFTVTLTPNGKDLASAYDVVLLDSAGGETSSKESVPVVHNEQDGTYTMTIELTAGQTKRIKGLPVGVGYSVEEESKPNYSPDYTDERGTVSSTTTPKAIVTNTYNAPGVETGSLNLSKTVQDANGNKVDPSSADTELYEFEITLTLPDGTAPNEVTAQVSVTDPNGEAVTDSSRNFPTTVTFTTATATVTFKLKNGEKLTISGLPKDTVYTVEEKLTDEQKTVYETPTSSTAGGTDHKVGTSTSVSFINKLKAVGDLDISKTVIGDGAPAGDIFTFTVTLTPPEGTVLAAAYNVVLLDAVTRDETGAPQPVSVVDNEDGTYTMTIELTAGQTKRIKGLPVGVGYSVEETERPNYKGVGSGTNGNIVAGSNQTAFTNTYTAPIGGRLQILKTVQDANGNKVDPSGADTELYAFEIKLTLPIEGTDSVTVKVSAVNFNNEAVTDTGRQLPQSITYVGNDTGTVSAALNVQLKNGETLTISGLPENTTYTVEEKLTADQKSAYEAPTVDPDTDANGVIGTEGSIISVGFINRLKAVGDLDISKTVEGTDAPADDTFTFTVTLTPPEGSALAASYPVVSVDADGKESGTPQPVSVIDNKDGTYAMTIELAHGETKRIKGLPVGVGYSVKEDTPDGYTCEITDKGTGSIAADPSKVAAVNTYNITRVDLAVSKTVKDANGVDDPSVTKRFSFEIKITLPHKVLQETTYQTEITGSGTVDPITFAANQSEATFKFQLAYGESLTITGLPSGTQYAVKETVSGGYIPSVEDNNASGTLESTNATVKFINSPKAPSDKKKVPTIPKTSDDQPLQLWISLLLLSVLGMALTLINFKRSRKHS